MTDQLAQSSDLQTWLGVTDPPLARTTLALQTATGWVQGFTGQKLVPVANETITIRNRHATRELYLPERPVTAVASVTVGNIPYSTAGTDWTLVDDCLLTGLYADAYSAGWKGRWAYWPEFVTVTYSHGYATAPSDIKGVVLSAAARIMANPVGSGSWAVGGVSYGGSGSSGGLTPDERVTLTPYRQLVVA